MLGDESQGLIAVSDFNDFSSSFDEFQLVGTKKTINAGYIHLQLIDHKRLTTFMPSVIIIDFVGVW